eukprot:1296268-Amphidinium_carterae.1
MSLGFSACAALALTCEEKVTGSGLGGEQVVENTLLPGLEIMGEEREEDLLRVTHAQWTSTR